MAKWVTAAEAVAAIEPGAKIVLPPGCGEATAFTTAMLEDSGRLAGCRLYSGLLLGEYPFLAEPHVSRLAYGTWHVMRPARPLIDAGRVDFYPIRASQVARLLAHAGIDVAVVQVSPPDANGYMSVGVSTSYPYPVARSAPVVIAEVNPRMPRTLGECRLHESEITYAFEADHPLVEYRASAPDDLSIRIAGFVAPLIPDNAALQIGIGGIPEAILLALRESARRGLTMFGMGIDGAVDLWDAGVLATDRPAMIGAELMGTTRLFDWAHENEQCDMRDFAGLFDPARAKALGPLVSINSTLEIDLWGNANSEVAGSSQVSGVGGSVDFMELAVRSGSGKSILALAATAKNGSVSKIVTRLSGVPYTIPRSAVQWVATEYGVVDLSVLSLDERAKAMVGLAAPQFRDQLWNDYLALRRQPARPFPATA